MSKAQERTTSRKPVAFAVAAALALGATFTVGNLGTANAAPLSVNQTALKDAVPENVVGVHRRHRSGAVVAGLALGIIGAAIAAHEYKRYRRHHHPYHHAYGYHPHYYYGPPACIRRHGVVYCR